MIQFNESIFNDTIINKDIDKLLMNIYKLCNCDIISIITLDIDSKLAMSNKILNNKNNNCSYCSFKVWKKRLNESYLKKLKLLFDKGQIIFSKKGEFQNNDTLFEKIKEEIFIPIITDKDKIIICTYLCILDNNNVNKSMQIDRTNIDKLVYSLRNLYKILYLSNQKIEVIFNLLNVMVEIIRNKEPLMVFHPFNVANMSKQIAIQLGLCDSKIQKIYFGGLFHDIGKLYIDRSILNKTTELTEDEYNILKKHSIYGYNILKDIWKEAAIYVKYHHERVDGSGYPYKLKGDEIPIESKIISIADTIDAITSHRSYKDSKNLNFLIAELVHSIGSQFNSEIVDAAIKVIIEYKNKDCSKSINFVELGTLTVKTFKNSLSIEGIIGKTSFGYVFRADTFNFTTDIDITEIQSIYAEI
ncbi:HD-GYP domain-containing protein [Clostridium kluyveri]|uniref:HD-GYP domain-containing protein n=2 Tax=Clostridium kluyveri TaxID=1534 RepID=A5N520_CLOK5|nr:HD-GYP domain-containing protein [Clostridium kluyveri]EDK32401.1 Conserved hypothetical protein [Clostridium kluyveri DSM 555]BAH05349.1 hypothetical protein CKR_0298 [Clostridium kluyveri NBRC 12016]